MSHPRPILGAVVLCIAAGQASADSWPMKHADAQKTGRAMYAVPASRQNSGLFDVMLWQKRTPGSPGNGALGSSSIVFFDGAGSGGANVAVLGYHWPKGVLGVDRGTGKQLWSGLPAGGESIGEMTAAFAPNGATVYVTNDATASGTWPSGHPLMAFSAATGPATFRHNGGMPSPGMLSAISPTIAPDGRVFLHSWCDGPYGGVDTGSQIVLGWSPPIPHDTCFNDPALYGSGASMMVVVPGRSGAVRAYAAGAIAWQRQIDATMDASATIDPANGRVFVPAGSDDVYVAGLTATGQNLWAGSPRALVYDWQPGVNNPHRAQSAGCLSHDGATFYFQTVSQQADGRLFAVNTSNGSLKWSLDTGSTGWEGHMSSPTVTLNAIIFVGNNDGDDYLAIRDDGTTGTILDTVSVDAAGSARATAAISAAGLLYLPLRTYWTATNGDGEAPNGQIENLFSCVDLREGAVPGLPPPANQAAFSRNQAVFLEWTPVPDPGNAFDHYAVYRDTTSFSSVEGRTPIATVTPRTASSYLDATASNGVSYWYAVTTVTTGGGETTAVQSIGPRTPRDETDLQVVSVARTPRYERFAPAYTGTVITEPPPTNFGPYFFTAATGLGSGQTGATQRWPNVGQPITYTATIRNRGTNPWAGMLQGEWRIDGQVVLQVAEPVNLAPGDVTGFNLGRVWDDLLHSVEFRILNVDARPGNNAVLRGSKGAGFLTYIDASYMEQYRENTPLSYPQAETDDLIDWLNTHMVRFNQMFQDAGTQKRTHYEILTVLPDGSPDPSVNTLQFAIFPFRYHNGEGDPRLSGYYNPGEDIDFGLLHEMGHQLGLIDLYQLDTPGSINQVSGLPYTAVDCLMRTCAPFLSEHSAGAMELWLHKAHGYFGQYMYSTPDQVRMRFLGTTGQPLANATVKMYQRIERPGVGVLIPNEIKFQGTTNAQGEITLPNVPINAQLAPTTFAGDTLKPNPFGYIAVVGPNGVLHFKIEHQGFSDFAWLDITEVNTAYWSGQTAVATFERSLLLGGPIQTHPPADLAELNASSWKPWAQGATAAVFDDSAVTTTGQASVRFETTGGFDTSLRYPGDRLARWDLSDVQFIRFWARAVNPNIGFQEESPRIRLISENGHYEWRSPSTVLNQAIGNWVQFAIPIVGSPQWPRTIVGTPSLTSINAIEIHADTWGFGFTLWVDGVRFDPPPCYPDCNADNNLSIADFACFQAAFVAGQPYADCTQDGVWTIGDFGCFQSKFVAGCP